ncbi:MAG: MBL fold metallo-hydrolase [Spirochaetales bacterium]|nr:MBL fold metallo-hydrolase [Spirochaetales bacterium]
MIKRVIVGIIGTNCYIFYNEKKNCIIIDPGGNETEIIADIKNLGLKPLAIVLTHGHFDHIAATGKLKEYYAGRGVNVSVAIHEADSMYLGENAGRINKSVVSLFGFEGEKMFQRYFPRMPSADLFLKENDAVFDSGLMVLETPGHTKGGICLYSEKDGLLFSGDTLFCGGIGRSDLPGGNENLLVNSIKSKLLILPPETTVYPGHGPTTTISNEISSNPFIN